MEKLNGNFLNGTSRSHWLWLNIIWPLNGIPIPDFNNQYDADML
jgi:hypothetical protein